MYSLSRLPVWLIMVGFVCLCPRAILQSAPVPQPTKPVATPHFDGDRAFALLTKQCSFGPRAPGLAGHDQAKQFLLRELKDHTDRAWTQDFVGRVGDKELALTNVLALIESTAKPKPQQTILLCAHWDTRPMADKESDPARRKQPILGANDGASGVAVLLELARALPRNKLIGRILIALLDGEDYGETAADMFLGSRYFAAHLPTPRPDWGILLDMVGDRDLTLYVEQYSWQKAKPVVERVWQAARKLKSPVFREGIQYAVQDDHLPINAAGIPCIDLIDMEYPYWHTLADAPNQCSATSLARVGEVLLAVLTSQ